MYRFLMNDGKVRIFWNNEELKHTPKPIKIPQKKMVPMLHGILR